MVNEIGFLIEGETTPMSLAKAIIDSRIFSTEQLKEFYQYLEVYAIFHPDEACTCIPQREVSD